jgi:hypothetical protein
MHLSSSEQMQVKVIDRLSAVRSSIDNHAIASIEACSARDDGGLGKQVAKQRSLLWRGLGQ